MDRTSEKLLLHPQYVCTHTRSTQPCSARAAPPRARARTGRMRMWRRAMAHLLLLSFLLVTLSATVAPAPVAASDDAPVESDDELVGNTNNDLWDDLDEEFRDLALSSGEENLLPMADRDQRNALTMLKLYSHLKKKQLISEPVTGLSKEERMKKLSQKKKALKEQLTRMRERVKSKTPAVEIKFTGGNPLLVASSPDPQDLQDPAGSAKGRANAAGAASNTSTSTTPAPAPAPAAPTNLVPVKYSQHRPNGTSNSATEAPVPETTSSSVLSSAVSHQYHEQPRSGVIYYYPTEPTKTMELSTTESPRVQDSDSAAQNSSPNNDSIFPPMTDGHHGFVQPVHLEVPHQQEDVGASTENPTQSWSQNEGHFSSAVEGQDNSSDQSANSEAPYREEGLGISDGRPSQNSGPNEGLFSSSLAEGHHDFGHSVDGEVPHRQQDVGISDGRPSQNYWRPHEDHSVGIHDDFGQPFSSGAPPRQVNVGIPDRSPAYYIKTPVDHVYPIPDGHSGFAQEVPHQQEDVGIAGGSLPPNWNPNGGHFSYVVQSHHGFGQPYISEVPFRQEDVNIANGSPDQVWSPNEVHFPNVPPPPPSLEEGYRGFPPDGNPTQVWNSNGGHFLHVPPPMGNGPLSFVRPLSVDATPHRDVLVLHGRSPGFGGGLNGSPSIYEMGELATQNDDQSTSGSWGSRSSKQPPPEPEEMMRAADLRPSGRLAEQEGPAARFLPVPARQPTIYAGPYLKVLQGGAVGHRDGAAGESLAGASGQLDGAPQLGNWDEAAGASGQLDSAPRLGNWDEAAVGRLVETLHPTKSLWNAQENEVVVKDGDEDLERERDDAFSEWKEALKRKKAEGQKQPPPKTFYPDTASSPYTKLGEVVPTLSQFEAMMAKVAPDSSPHSHDPYWPGSYPPTARRPRVDEIARPYKNATRLEKRVRRSLVLPLDMFYAHSAFLAG